MSDPMRDLIKRYTRDLPDSLELSRKELSDLKRRARFFAECFYDEGYDKCEHYTAIYHACTELERLAEIEEVAAIEHALKVRKEHLERMETGSLPVEAAIEALEKHGSGTILEDVVPDEVEQKLSELRDRKEKNE